jgi:hypothetical protein
MAGLVERLGSFTIIPSDSPDIAGKLPPRVLPDSAENALYRLQEKITAENDPAKIVSYSIAYEKILDHFKKEGFDKSEIEEFRNDLKRILGYL